MPRKKRLTRKQKQKKTPHLKVTSKYAVKQKRKREAAALRAGLPKDATWIEIDAVERKGKRQA